MGRIKFCIAILIALVIFCGSSLLIIKSQSERLCVLALTVKELSENKKTDEALDACHELARFWESYYKMLSVFVKGDKLAGINASVAKIQPYLEDENEELYAELDSILYQTNWVSETEFPYFYNVF